MKNYQFQLILFLLAGFWTLFHAIIYWTVLSCLIASKSIDSSPGPNSAIGRLSGMLQSANISCILLCSALYQAYYLIDSCECPGSGKHDRELHPLPKVQLQKVQSFSVSSLIPCS